MNKELNWTKEAFSREVIIIENDQPVGSMHRSTLFSLDADAHLYEVGLRFDVTGFFRHSVTIHDRKASNRVVDVITLHFGKRAELRLESGELYTWKRHDVGMREWDMVRGGITDADVRETIKYSLNYSATRQFFADHGDIRVDDSPNASVAVLAGFFIRDYFQRRRRRIVAATA